MPNERVKFRQALIKMNAVLKKRNSELQKQELKDTGFLKHCSDDKFEAIFPNQRQPEENIQFDSNQRPQKVSVVLYLLA